MSVKQSSVWIDRYVNEVGRRLPQKQRDDVTREIRSLIEDEVAGRQAVQDVQTDSEEIVLAVLQSFGSPADMAARYHAPRSLIGPGLLPSYRLVLGIVLTVTLVVNLVGLAVAAGTQTAPSLLATLLSLFGSLIQAVGMMTLIFVILGYFGVGSDVKPEPWEARSLPPIDDPDRISIAEIVADIAGAAVSIILLNGYLNRGTGALFFDGEWQAIPLFSPEFLQFVPWFTVAWGADLVVNLVVLLRGRWEAATRLAAIVVAGAFAFITYQTLVSGPIAAWQPLDPAFKVTAVIIFAVSVWEVAKHSRRLLQGSSPASTPSR